MSPDPDGTAPARSSRERARLLAIAILSTVAVLFAVFNLEEVKVNLIIGSARLPLIVVIVACLLIGAVIGLALGRRGKDRGRDRGKG